MVRINSIVSVNVRDGSAGNALTIRYDGLDQYTLGLGFDDVVTVLPSHRQSSLTAAYNYFRARGYEFELYRNETSPKFEAVTLGRLYSDTTGLCFYAAGQAAAPVVANLGLLNTYVGIADGFALQNGRTTRLFGSPATVSIDYRQRSGTIRIDLSGREPAFGEFLGATAVPIGQAMAQFVLAPGSSYISSATLTGPDGATGTVTGLVFGTGLAAGFGFDLRFPNGDRAFGTVAVNVTTSSE